MKICPYCGTKNKNNWRWCINCQEKLDDTIYPDTYSCPKCGCSISKNAKECFNCGYKFPYIIYPEIKSIDTKTSIFNGIYAFLLVFLIMLSVIPFFVQLGIVVWFDLKIRLPIILIITMAIIGILKKIAASSEDKLVLLKATHNLSYSKMDVYVFTVICFLLILIGLFILAINDSPYSNYLAVIPITGIGLILVNKYKKAFISLAISMLLNILCFTILILFNNGVLTLYPASGIFDIIFAVELWWIYYTYNVTLYWYLQKLVKKDMVEFTTEKKKDEKH